MAHNAQKIAVGVATIDSFICTGCFDGRVPITITWPAGARNPATIKFVTGSWDNVSSVEVAGSAGTPTPAEVISDKNGQDVGISGCLTDPCKDGSFLVTVTSSVTIEGSPKVVTIPGRGYSVSGLQGTNGTSDDPNKPFVPIAIKIKDCRPAGAGAPRRFTIALHDISNCAALIAAPAAVNVGPGQTSGPIRLSGNKVDGTVGGEFSLVVTTPAPLKGCSYPVKVE